MVEQWTVELVAKMHQYNIKKYELANKLGMSAEYTGKVLNGRKSPRNAKERFSDALNEIISTKVDS